MKRYEVRAKWLITPIIVSGDELMVSDGLYMLYAGSKLVACFPRDVIITIT